MRSAIELGADIAAGTCDPVELAEKTLGKIESCEHAGTIFARLTPERARLEAEAARKRQSENNLCSPLDGVPISWKDLFDTAGVATESGSWLLKGRVPRNDAKALANARTAGLVCVGKTHLSELAFSGLGINPKTATAPNKYGTHLAPGGSSSGAAASVAENLVPIGIGSDTGGSVRIPSAWNDLVGLKTSFGLISSEGIVPLCPAFDTAGPLCTSVSDAWIMTAIMAGLPPILPQQKPLGQCRFLVNNTLALDDLGDDQREGFEIALDALRSAGAIIERAVISEFEEINPLGPVLFPFEAWKQWGETINANPGVMFEPVENRFRSGEGLSQAQYQEAWARMMELRRSFNMKTLEFDAVLAPTVPIGPPEIEPLLSDPELFGATNMMALRNTRFFNMFGACALSLPTSRPASGLMMAASGGKDVTLVGVGLSVEKTIS